VSERSGPDDPRARSGPGEPIPPVIEHARWAVAYRERILGDDHPDTLAARHDLADTYRVMGPQWRGEAIAHFERLLADRERALGPDHPDTLTTWNFLAATYESAGRLGEAVALYERVLAGFERVLGPDASRTLLARDNLAHTCAGMPGGWMRRSRCMSGPWPAASDCCPRAISTR
jgi:hypothetical protein